MTSLALLVGSLILVLALNYVWTTWISPDRNSADSMTGYILANRNLSTPLFVATFIATGFSTASIIGVPGLMYRNGVSAIIFGAVGMSLLGLFGLLFGKRLMRLAEGVDLYSPLELITLKYNSSILASLIAVITVILVTSHLAIQFIGFARFAGAYDPQAFDESILSAVLLLGILAYSFGGGARAIAVTDFVQVVFVILGVVIVAYMCLDAFNGLDLIRRVKSEHPKHLTFSGPNEFFTIPVLVSMVLILGSGALSNPQYSMRLLMSRKVGSLNYLFFCIVFTSIIIFTGIGIIGLTGLLLFPNLASGDDVLGSLLASRDVVPSWAAWIFFVGVVCAAASTIDSQLLAIGGVLTRHVFKPLLGESADERKIVKTTLVCISALAFIISLRPPELIVELALVVLAGGLQLVPTLLGIFLRHPSPLAGYVSIAFGIGTYFGLRYLYGVSNFWGWDVALISFVVAYTAFWVVQICINKKIALA